MEKYELTEFMADLFKRYNVGAVKRIKIINHKYDGCTVLIYTASGQNVGCRLEYHTDAEVIKWIEERYEIIDTQTYEYNAEMVVTIMVVRKK